MRLELAHKTDVACVYTLQRIGPDGVVREQRKFSNRIVNTGLDATGGAYAHVGPSGRKAMYVTCAVGTGQAAPTNLDTALTAQRASVAFPVTGSVVNGQEAYVTAAPRYWRRIQRCSFGPGVANGDITEIGVFSEGGVLFSRALVRDSIGRPIAVKVLADETLNVTFEARVYIRPAIAQTLVDREGNAYAIVGKAYNISTLPELDSQYGGFVPTAVAHESAAVLDETTPVSGVSANLALLTTTPYVVGSKTRKYKYTLDQNTGNFSQGIGSIVANYLGGRDRWTFDPPLRKTNRFVLRVELLFSWDRYAP